MSIDLLLLVIALVCFVCAAAGVTSNLNLIGVGLACWVLTLLIALAKLRKMERESEQHERDTRGR